MTILKNCRVLDLGIITAGAGTSALLADFGAEVIKVESVTYKDPFRVWPTANGADTAELSPFFRATNRGKANLCLNLKHPAGRALFLRLVAKSDIVVENFRRGVLGRLGLGLDVLAAANPKIILASVSSQGETGPDSDYVSFGSTLEAVGGLADATGYPDGPPVITGRELNFPDQIAVMYAASVIMTAWFSRQDATGPVHLDLSQRELTTYLCGDMQYGRQPVRNGNGDPHFPGQNCYLCADRRWIAVSPSKEQAAVLCDWLDCKPPALGATLAAWAETLPSADAVTLLSERGIAVERVADGADLLAADAGWETALVQAQDGMILKGIPLKPREFDITINQKTADLGEDTVDILTRLAGCSLAEVELLAKEGVVAYPDSGDADRRIAARS